LREIRLFKLVNEIVHHLPLARREVFTARQPVDELFIAELLCHSVSLSVLGLLRPASLEPIWLNLIESVVIPTLAGCVDRVRLAHIAFGYSQVQIYAVLPHIGLC
jgi:hypothetical protein